MKNQQCAVCCAVFCSRSQTPPCVTLCALNNISRRKKKKKRDKKRSILVLQDSTAFLWWRLSSGSASWVELMCFTAPKDHYMVATRRSSTDLRNKNGGCYAPNATWPAFISFTISLSKTRCVYTVSTVSPRLSGSWRGFQGLREASAANLCNICFAYFQWKWKTSKETPESARVAVPADKERWRGERRFFCIFWYLILPYITMQLF